MTTTENHTYKVTAFGYESPGGEEYGWGDYYRVDCYDLGTVEATSVRGAQAAVRKMLAGSPRKIYFSGIRPTHHVELVK